MTSPRGRLWTNRDSTFNMSAAGQAGQLQDQTLANLQVGLGITHLAGYTIVDTHVQMHFSSDDSDVSTGVVRFHFGIGVFHTGMDAGDFPPLELYEGDWLWYGTVTLRMPGAANTPLVPAEHAIQMRRSRAQRRLTDVGQAAFLVYQQSSALGVDIFVSTQHLVLMP